MRCAVVFLFSLAAFASGATWQEPLLGAAKIPAAEIDRMGKEVELAAHKAVHCFYLSFVFVILRVASQEFLAKANSQGHGNLAGCPACAGIKRCASYFFAIALIT